MRYRNSNLCETASACWLFSQSMGEISQHSAFPLQSNWRKFWNEMTGWMDSSQVELYSHSNALAQPHVLTASAFWLLVHTFSCAVPQFCLCSSFSCLWEICWSFLLILGFDCSAAMGGTGAKRSEWSRRAQKKLLVMLKIISHCSLDFLWEKKLALCPVELNKTRNSWMAGVVAKLSAHTAESSLHSLIKSWLLSGFYSLWHCSPDSHCTKQQAWQMNHCEMFS